MTVLIGVGNAYRSDDSAGLEVAARLGGIAHEGDMTGLLGLWSDAPEAIVVDAASSGASPGTIHRFDAAAGPLPAGVFASTSTHAFGLAEAIELGRSLGRLPIALRVYAIEGANFEAGTELSPAVSSAVDALVSELRPALPDRTS